MSDQTRLKDTISGTTAVGNGTIDDTAAIVAWYAAIPDGGEGIIPNGRFRFTSQLTFNRNVTIKGYGPASCLMPDLASSTTDAIVVNSVNSVGLYRMSYKNFSILNDTANCCRDTIVFNRAHVVDVDIHVKAASARYGVRVNGCLEGRFRIVTSGNFSYPYASGLPAADMLRVQRDTTNLVSSNGNIFDLIFEAGLANGAWVEDQSSQGNNTFLGVIEGCAAGTRSFYAKGCIGLNINGLHCESNHGSVELDGCQSSEVSGGSQFIPAGNSGLLTLTGCTGILLGAAYVDGLVLDSACKNIQATAAFKYGTATDPAGVLRLPTGSASGLTASTASGVAVALEDISTRGQGRYVATAYVQNLGVAYHAIADLVWDGANASLKSATNGTLLALTLVGSTIKATQTSGGALAIAYNVEFIPT